MNENTTLSVRPLRPELGTPEEQLDRTLAFLRAAKDRPLKVRLRWLALRWAELYQLIGRDPDYDPDALEMLEAHSLLPCEIYRAFYDTPQDYELWWPAVHDWWKRHRKGFTEAALDIAARYSEGEDQPLREIAEEALAQS